MTDAAMPPEAPSAAEITHFLRRFADLMSNGQNANYLLRAAELLETLTGRVSAASDEEQLWRYKYESLSQHADTIEAECERLKNDIEGHVHVAGFILAERDSLRTALEAREAELSELGGALQSEQDRLALISEAQEARLAELRTEFEQERIALRATAEVSSKEIDQLRRVFEREGAELSTALKTREAELSELRFAADRERSELQSQLNAREDQLAALRAASAHEQETFETKRAELRLAFDRISKLRVQTESGQTAPDSRPEMQHDSPPEPRHARDSAIDEASAMVPKETLRQARAQFEFLAKECVRRGDLATQAMCELGAHTMELALTADEGSPPLPVREVARSILRPGSASPASIGN